MPVSPIFETRQLTIETMLDGTERRAIVEDVNLRVHPGEVMAVIGESGSGKTTLALSALGYCRPGLGFAGGEAIFMGQDLTRLAKDDLRDIRGSEVSYLAQSAAATFNPSLKIGTQVTEAAIAHGLMSRRQARERALELFVDLDLPDPETIGERYPHQVSGGQLQRLMAAMAMVTNPRLLVLDEPTTALDVTTQIEVLKAFKKVLRQDNAAAIYVTHDLAVVAQIADTVTVLYDGKVKECGPVRDVIERPGHGYTRKLMDAAVRDRKHGLGWETTGAQDDDVPLLAMRDIDAGYGRASDGGLKVQALNNVTLDMTEGHAVGLVGESGCGKSTLGRVMSGLLPASSGVLALRGKPLNGSMRDRTIDELREIQIVFQMADTALNPNQRIREILGRPLQFYFDLSGKSKAARIAELLRTVELPETFVDRFPHELSGGQKQRINLARALAAEPSLIICDEVTSALDTIVAENIIDLLTRLRRETGVSFLFISHDLPTVRRFADELVVLYAGKVVERGPTEEVLTHPSHPYTRLLLSSVPKVDVSWLDETARTRDALTAVSGEVQFSARGCPFVNRCGIAIGNLCETTEPPVQTRLDSKQHSVCCHTDLADFLKNPSAGPDQRAANASNT